MTRLFPFIWRRSKREQIAILIVVLVSFPFYYVSLDLPKLIISNAIQGRAFEGGNTVATLFEWTVTLPSWAGGQTFRIFDGLAFDRVGYLFALSGVFLIFVLINGGFKYVINMRKGALGERFLQNLRFDLFSRLLAFSPEALNHVKPAEAATMIKDEVEPIGTFVGDAFILPVFLGGQALTALLFILIQSPSLGCMALAIVVVQAALIPRLRRQQLRLAKERQLKSRALAGKIGEVVDCVSEIGNHGTSAFERDNVSDRLETLFSIRYRLFGRKFAVKFTNNLLAQVTPFLFYTIGGFYALKGTIDIGQLVAVIAAYRDLPPPVKELIDWDQQRQDVETKFQQVIVQFMAAEDAAANASEAVPAFDHGTIAAQAVKVTSSAGDPLLDRISVNLPLGSHIAFVDLGGDGARTFAQLLGRRVTVFEGALRIAGTDIAALPPEVTGRAFAYVGSEPGIFDASLRDNILYGLRKAGPNGGAGGAAQPAAWIDYAAAGAADAAELEAILIETLRTVGLADTIFRFGLSRRIDPAQNPDVVARVVDVRSRLKARLADLGAAGVVEPFDPTAYAVNATIGENILFGVPVGDELSGPRLADHAFVRSILDREGLAEPLTEMGQRIAATMIEIFKDLPPDHVLFEQFAFIPAEQFPVYEDILARAAGGGLNDADRSGLIALAFLYVEPRHRLGLLTPALQAQILAARHAFRAQATPAVAQAIEFYDPERFCAAAPLRDNLLFGLIAYGAATAAERAVTAIQEVVAEVGLEREVYRLGLEQAAGYAGRLLFPAQKTAVALARCLIKRPSLLILNDALGALGEAESVEMLARVRAVMQGRTLIVVGRKVDSGQPYDVEVAFDGPRIKSIAGEGTERPIEMPTSDESVEREELKALRAVPIFAEVDLARLKLLAFTSERVAFAPGEVLVHQGDPSDSAYVMVAGSADVIIETRSGPVVTSHVGPGAIIGEMGVITGDPRSATVRAAEPVTTLRLRKDIFLSLLAEFPQMALAMTRLMVRRLQENVTAAGQQSRTKPE